MKLKRKELKELKQTITKYIGEEDTPKNRTSVLFAEWVYMTARESGASHERAIELVMRQQDAMGRGAK